MYLLYIIKIGVGGSKYEICKYVNIYPLRMRLFLKIKQNGRQLTIRRIETKQQMTRTQQLIDLISSSLGVPMHSFIVRILQEQNKFRVVGGWGICLYGIRSGLQIQVQLLPTQGHGKYPQTLKDNPQLNTKPMEQITQDQQQEKTDEVSQLVTNKYEQLLKYIQNNNTEMYFKTIKASCPQIGPCENQFYKKQLMAIQNELGANGWAAIHCAVIAGNLQITTFLIQLNVDLNLKTFDDWLPIQLAINHQYVEIVQKLLEHPSLNINISTSHGLPLNMAVSLNNLELVSKMLVKEINFSARDHKNRTVFDIFGPEPSGSIYDLLSRQQKRQSISFQDQKVYHSLITCFRGQVILVKTPPRKSKQCYIQLNPYEKMIRIFQDKQQYPRNPKQTFALDANNKFKQLTKSDKSWFMSSQKYYFSVTHQKNKYIFGCNFEETSKRWLVALHQCQDNVNKYPDSIGKFVKNDTPIIDRINQKLDRKQSFKSNKDLLQIFSPTKANSNREEQQFQKKQSIQNKLTNTSQRSEQKSNGKVQKQSSPTKESVKEPGKQRGNAQVEALLKNSLKFKDFKIMKTLGQGSFGTVFLAMDLRNPEGNKQFALKCFKKKKLVVNKQIKYTIAELNILKQLSHPFIVNLHFTFQTPNFVYLGLDYCPNQDLSHHLMNQVTFSEKDAKIYAAEILLALQYLHQRNIIYRDLKPENIMLDNEGHVRLVDFGLSKQGSDTNFVAKSFCGSPAYLSPEMLAKRGVSKQSDYYCLGAVLYEMIVGEPPFFSEDITTLYNNINKSELSFPKKKVSDEVQDLLRGMLQRNPKKRLGYKGVDEIKNHQFFKKLDWDALLKKQIKAPVRQQIQTQQQIPLAMQTLHNDFDYTVDNYRVNRFLNFSFVREESPV